jgi:BioD-like phosphotransacetylase family protein
MKPIGQRAVPVDQDLVDEDAVLLHTVDGVAPDLAAASPVTLPHGYTTRFLRGGGDVEALRRRIREAYAQIAREADVVVVEGTGHAGVGSVVGLCNAAVAALLGVGVVIVTGGGLGRPIDEFNLNRALYEKHGVQIIGAVANKFHPERRSQVEPLLRSWFEKEGVPLLGVIPFEVLLTELTLQQIVNEIGARVLCGEEHVTRTVRECVIMAAPHRLLQLLRPGVLAIIPGDRDDLLLTAATCDHLARERAGSVAVCLTCDASPDPRAMDVVRRSGVPVIASSQDTYQVAAEISDLVAKMMPTDAEKIGLAKRLVAENLDLDALLDGARQAGRRAPRTASRQAGPPA